MLYAGNTIEHTDIVLNLVELIRSCLGQKGCRIYDGNHKLYSPAYQKSFLYHDLHIYGGSIEKAKLPHGAYALKDPRYIVEALSRETRDYDFNKKFACYRQISSLAGYLLVESDL